MLKYKIKKSKINIKKENIQSENIMVLGSHFINPKINNNKKYKLSFFKLKIIIFKSEEKNNYYTLFQRSLNIFKKKIQNTNIFFLKFDWDDNILIDSKLNTHLYSNEKNALLIDNMYKNNFFEMSYELLFKLLLF